MKAMAEEGRLTVTCEFCKTDYVFDEGNLDSLWP
jgi:redox-regulated HSP33 family molecular chaperone